ncbi:unnamed protein product [Moneuplotes crassus]|uniref:Uncharacterized protein n=1 Tax=Euplotes crassus TaxID=5936 RepID=A0AAD2D3L2_EUPCR|nr:unnamed protein product [Moneuplotes crassus]
MDSLFKTCCLKTIIVGNCGVGKTNLQERIAYDRMAPLAYTLRCDFNHFNYEIQSEDLIKNDSKYANLKLPETIKIKSQLWDTAGQERFRPLMKSYYRGASFAFIVYAISDRNSFEDVEYWVNVLEKFTVCNTIVLIGNKIDLEDQRMVSYDEGKELADEYGFDFVETSVLEGIGTAELMPSILIKTLKNHLDSYMC